VLPDHLQHHEESGRGTSEGKEPVDCTDRAEAPPRFLEHDITVTERRVRSTGEIPAIAERGQVARLPEKGCPHRGLRDVRHEKKRNCCKDDENIRRSAFPEGRPCPVQEQPIKVSDAEENSGMEGRDKHGEQQRQGIHLQQDAQAVGRSGCFLLHSKSVARMGILSQDIVASGKSPRLLGA
jgi:hypothetical protein